MRICCNNDKNISYGSSWYSNFFEKLPNKEIKNSAKYNKIGNALASPHWNRAVIGLAAISTQPAIDYFNPRVDKDTATAASLRTLAKICVCTAVGFCVRGGAYKLVNKYANENLKGNSSILIPKEILNETNNILKTQKLKLHKNALSTVSAICIMLVTNFLLDAPLTTKFTNYLISKYMSANDSPEVKR